MSHSHDFHVIQSEGVIVYILCVFDFLIDRSCLDFRLELHTPEKKDPSWSFRPPKNEVSYSSEEIRTPDLS